jgi:hypothetical protein
MSGKRQNTHITGNVGLYFVCYKLSAMGWNVMPTARNAKGIDIIAYNSNMTKMISIQVKTLNKKANVFVNNKSENITGKYWIIVNNIEKEPRSFILLSSEVKKRLSYGIGKSGKVAYWLPLKRYKEFEERWERIGYAE